LYGLVAIRCSYLTYLEKQLVWFLKQENRNSILQWGEWMEAMLQIHILYKQLLGPSWEDIEFSLKLNPTSKHLSCTHSVTTPVKCTTSIATYVLLISTTKSAVHRLLLITFRWNNWMIFLQDENVTNFVTGVMIGSWHCVLNIIDFRFVIWIIQNMLTNELVPHFNYNSII